MLIINYLAVKYILKNSLQQATLRPYTFRGNNRIEMIESVVKCNDLSCNFSGK